MTPHAELSAFQAITEELLALLEPLSEERMNQVAVSGGWSPGQLGEHLLKSYRLVDLSQVQGTPSPRPVHEKAALIDGVFLDFTTKYQPPAALVPSTEKINGRALVTGLRNSTEAIAAFVREHDLAFTSPEFEVIGFGDLTAQEVVHFWTAHSKRHVHQLKSILRRP